MLVVEKGLGCTLVVVGDFTCQTNDFLDDQTVWIDGLALGTHF